MSKKEDFGGVWYIALSVSRTLSGTYAVGRERDSVLKDLWKARGSKKHYMLVRVTQPRDAERPPAVLDSGEIGYKGDLEVLYRVVPNQKVVTKKHLEAIDAAIKALLAAGADPAVRKGLREASNTFVSHAEAIKAVK